MKGRENRLLSLLFQSLSDNVVSLGPKVSSKDGGTLDERNLACPPSLAHLRTIGSAHPRARITVNLEIEQGLLLWACDGQPTATAPPQYPSQV